MPKTSFDPAVHGFHFENAFTNRVANLPGFGPIETQGRCGGMAFAALDYQGDGNLVLYNAGGALWASNTDGRPVGTCVMQGDGNLVIYARGGQAIWSSGTWQHPGSRLVVQDDGNAVIYKPNGRAVWATNRVQP